MPDTRLRIAVVGAGMIGRRHVELIRHSADCVLAAIVDPAPTAADYARTLDAPRFASLHEVLADARLDGIVLATPNQVHVPQALECIGAGVPVLVEKPIAHTVDAARTLCDAAEVAGVPVLVGHHRRHGAIIAKAVEIIAAGTLGRLVAAVGTALYYKPESDGYFDEAWRREPGGGPILINMIHEIDNLRALCGEIVAVQAFASNATRKFEVEDTAGDRAALCERCTGNVHAVGQAVSDRKLGTYGGRGSCLCKGAQRRGRLLPDRRHARIARSADDAYRALRRRAASTWHEPFVKSAAPLEVVDPLARQLAHFCDVIRRRATPRVSARDGLRNLHIVDAIGAAARSGCVVAIA